jgi:hypothetical protein
VLWYLLSCDNLGGHGRKSEMKVQTITPNSIFDFGVTVPAWPLVLWFGLLVSIYFAPTRMCHATEP